MNNTDRFRPAGPIERLWLYVEKITSSVTTSEYNPFYYLGAIGIFFLWIILVTGLYLFIFYSITASGAYDSVEKLTVNQWYLGGVMRSMHRYASDGLVVAMVLHTLRCYVLDRYKHWRWIAWVSGVVTAWIVWIGGIFGYWMVWDEKARVVAELSARMLENVPIFGLPLSLNFARVENLTDQLFYIILFIHFSSIFFIFLLLLVHITRITKSIINPPKVIGYGLVLVLLVASFIWPAVSAPPADLKSLPVSVPFDWYYMFIFPFLNFMSEQMLWLFIVTLTLVVGAVPWLTRSRRHPAVKVTYENCVGCELCSEDCPYEAVQMRPRTDGLPYELEAVVMPKRCASCGICVGSCDYSALDLPDIPEKEFKGMIRKLAAELADSSEAGTVLAFVCGNGVWIDGLGEGEHGLAGMPWVRVIRMTCTGMLQPAMIDLAQKKGVDGIFVAGCAMGDCSFRRGNEWFEARAVGYRAPIFRRSIDKSRVKAVWLSAVESKEFKKSLEEFHGSVGSEAGKGRD